MAFIKWNFEQFIQDYLPPKLRKPTRIADLIYLASGIITNYDSLVARRDADLFLIKHTGQSKSVEHFLNNFFDITGKPILIFDAEVVPNYYIGQDDEDALNVADSYTNPSGTDVDYNPTDLYIGQDDEATIDELTLWIGDDEGDTVDRLDFLVYIDNIDYADTNKVSSIQYYVNLFRPAGTTWKFITY